MKRGNVLLIANWDSDVGYAWWLMESFWVQIAEWAKQGDADAVLAFPSISTLPDSIAAAPLDTIVTDFNQRGFGAILAQCRLIRQRHCRTLYFSDHPMWSLRYALYRLAGARHIIVHDHTPGQRSKPTGIKRLLKRTLSRLPWINADHAFATTDFIRDRHIHVYCRSAESCHTVPNGIPSAAKVAALPLNQAFGIDPQQCVMITTSRANRYKGIDFAIRCVNELVHNQDLKQLHYLFCGDGPHLEEFAAMVESLNLQGHVTLAGRRSDIPALLPGCSFAFHPSQGEVGYSLSILEYMQAGLPVIVPDDPSVCGATAHGKDGLIYRQAELDSACDAIRQLLEHPDQRNRMGNNARTTVSERFTLQGTHKELIRLFGEIAT